MLRFCILITLISLIIVMPASAFKFKKQDIEKATNECVDNSPCKPELVATQSEDGLPNLALLEEAKPNADSLIAGWCPKRHCVEYLNDGFYNNCRSWISAKPSGQEAWAEIDMSAVYQIKRVGIGSDHCANYKDRAPKDFKILVATKYDADSGAGTWKTVYDNKKGEAVTNTTYFDFNAIDARYVRISVLSTSATEVRIDEIEIFGGALAVMPKNRVAHCWGIIKSEY